jgi:hypothetical protein
VCALGPLEQRKRGSVVLGVGLVIAVQYAPLIYAAAADVAAGAAAGSVPLACTLAMTGSLTAGAALFALGIPERWAPGGTFDQLGSSHQWMHVSAIAAHVLEYAFLRHMLQRHLDGGAAWVVGEGWDVGGLAFEPAPPPVPLGASSVFDDACSSLWYDYSSW